MCQPANTKAADEGRAMKRSMLFAGVLLAGCSQQPAATPPAAAASDAATPSPVASAADAVVDEHVVPRPGEQKTFGDWTVACDNVGSCAMASLGTDADFPTVTMQVSRRAGPAAGVEIALMQPQDGTVAPAALTIDARRFAVAPDGLAGAPALALARALAEARTVTVADAGGVRIGGISPTGASAALRYIDAQQGRAGTVTAIVARGDQPADTVPAARSLPRVAAVAFGGTAAALPPALVAGMRRTARCDQPLPGLTPRAQPLADGATLVLLPCSTGAYNEIDALFVVRDGKAMPAAIDAPAGFEATGADPETPVRSVVNGDVRDGVLTSYAKGRGLGDCGVMQGFVWDGTRLRLVEQRSMGECRGNPDYLTVWRAAYGRG
jgi:invasion protein IalB